MHKAPYVSPISGGRKTDHVKGNITALALSLSDEEMTEIDNAWPFDISFPMDFSNSDIRCLELITLTP
jgi:aryl-alcohol dehydrogenase-like predicted oxidoreductase